jgi:hypothetical protein
VANAAQKRIAKAYSAHGNAEANKRGWDTTNGVDGVITDTSSSTNVQCFDCHNSHGSTVDGVTTRYASATANGGILKDTTVERSGASVAYKPYSGGSIANKNKRNPGASLCLDCHMNQNATTTPWGYNSTYGATQQVLGYWDSPYMSYSGAGAKQRYAYKKANMVKGGHFGASSPLTTSAMSSIGGLCTPCHDPHGVSPTLGANQQYAVPLLKGTFLTSPYKEDVAPANNVWQTNYVGVGEGVKYHIDQNTFGAEIRSSGAGITQSVDQSAGLCLGCHPKNSLTAAGSPASPNPWKSKNRVHESVKGWKTSDAIVEHNYSCSKCHSAHTSSVLPRLMVTNCLDSKHKGRMGYNSAPVIAGSSSGDGGSGSGRIPGSYSGSGWDGGPGDYSVTCHDSPTANGYGADGTNQGWNQVTTWFDPTPVISSGPGAITSSRKVFLHMDEASWNGTANEVRDASWGNNHGTSYYATTVAGGITGNAGSFNGSYAYAAINYTAGMTPVDNFTIEAWIKPTTTHPIDTESTSGVVGTNWTKRYLFGADYMGDLDSGAGISAGTNGISVYEHGNAYMPALAVYSGSISSTSWTHIAVVYANKRPSIYVNGVLVRTGLQSPRAHVYAPRMIGGGPYGYFPGLVDEVAIYSKANTDAEILAHAQLDYSGFCGYTDVPVIWGSILNGTSYVDYGLTTSYGSTVGDASQTRTHSVTLPNLNLGATYHYRVRSQSTDGREAVSGDNTFQVMGCSEIAQPPSAATGISAAPGNTQVTISWTAGTGSTSSLIRYGTASGVYGTTIDPAVSPRTITGLANGTTIYYQVGAKNGVGTTWSSEYSVTPIAPPEAATGISAVAGNAQVTINWTAGVGSTSSLIRYGTASGVYGATIDPATSPRTITSLANGATIYYQVGAKNGVGTTWSAEYSVTPVGPPTGISSTGGDTQVTISWTAGTGSTSSLIRYGTASGVYGTTIDPATSPRTITGLTNGTTIYYQVGAKNAAGTTWSSEYSVTPIAPPAAATGISAVAGNAQVTITWTAGTGSTSSLIRYGTASGVYGTTVDPAVSPRTITGLANGTTIYYQVGAKNTAGTTWSAEYSVTPIGPPTGISAVAGNTQITITWTAGAGATSSLIRYGTASGVYGTTIDPAISPRTITGLTDGTTVFYQVGAKNAAGTTWSAEFNIISGSPPVPAPVLTSYNFWYGNNYYTYAYYSDCVNPSLATVTWNPVTSPDGDPVEYSVILNGVAQGWQSGTSFTYSAGPQGSDTWSVKARDAVHPTFESAYYSVLGLYIWDGSSCTKSSCPLVYSWNGTGFRYETDLQGPAISQIWKPGRNVYLYQPSYIVLDTLVPDVDLKYRVNIWESLPESTLLDEAKLLVVDYPSGYQIVSSGAENTYYYGYTEPFKIYTIKDPVLPKSATDKYGNDILSSVLALDDKPAPMAPDDPDNFYTIDFGTIQHPQYAKLVIDGWQDINSKIYLSTITIQPYVEVVDASGAWVKVKTFGMPMGDLKTMVVDLSNLFLSSDHRIRLHLGIKKAQVWVFDRIRLDDSAPVSVTVQELQASSADLQFGGNSIVAPPSTQHRMIAGEGGLPINPNYFGYGNFTRYGEVGELLTQRDDKYVIMNYADKLDLAFQTVPSPPVGMTRGFILKADLYYKDFKTYRYLDPLPFHGMSDYPPPPPEAYPTDADHLQYQQDYNTRVVTP